MKPRHRPAHAAIVHAVVASLVAEGADLNAVTLDEFKGRLRRTIRAMLNATKAAAA